MDDATEVTEWVCSELAGVPVFIPAIGAVGSGGNVQVVVSRADVAAAPPVGGVEHISGDEEVALYRHYGIPYSRDASATVLPAGDVEPSARDATSDDVETDVSVTPPDQVAADPTPAPVVVSSVAANPASADPAAVRPVAGSVDAKPLAVLRAARTKPVLAAEHDQSSESASPTGDRVWVGPALAGLVAVAVAAGVVCRARRLRQQRAVTRTERLADRGRAASVALSTRIARSRRPPRITWKPRDRPSDAGQGPTQGVGRRPSRRDGEVTAARRASRKRTG